MEQLAALAGVCAAGSCPLSAVALDEDSRRGLERLCADAKTVLVALFPYYAGERPGNLSLYARGADYHTVLHAALDPFARALSAAYPEHRFVALVDDSPLPEVELALRAGLGVRGENGLLLHPTYGSYVFIGTVVTDLDLGAEAAPVRECLHCGACRRACPGGALSASGFDEGRCLSALTQRSGALDETEEALVREHPLIWGCDRCQTVCPLNRAAKETANPAFRDDLIDRLTPADLEGLTRRGFAARYPNRAFTWKGPRPLIRNLALHAKEDS